MKKRRLKKWVKELLSYMLIVLMGFIMIFALYVRAEQVNRSMNYDKTIY